MIETFNMAFVVNDITVKAKSSIVLATESTSSNRNPLAEVSNSAFLIDIAKATVDAKTLPFPIKQSTWINNSIRKDSEIISLAVVDDKGEVALLEQGSTLPSQTIISTPTRLPSSTSGQSQLFDDIFGSAEVSSTAAPKITPAPTVTSKSLEILNAPSHSLPPARLLWRSMLGNLSTASNRPVTKAEKSNQMDVEMEVVVESTGVKIAEARFSTDHLSELFMEIL